MSTGTAKIVFLDGFALNPGDLSWDELQALGECKIYERSAAEEIDIRAKDAEIVLTNKVTFSRERLVSLDRLKYIGVTATGYNIIDVQAARELGIVVSNVPIYGTRSVAQMVFAHLLGLSQHVGEHAQSVREGRWSKAIDWCFWDFPLVELEGLTIGIVGLGRIGRATAELAHAFGMKVLATSRSTNLAPDYIKMVSLDELFRASDVVSLHCPLTPETENLVDRRRLALMKPTAFLLNTSRGPLIDEVALAEALNEGHLAGAGLDVLSQEPPPADSPLLHARNCQITPHIAWATRSSRSRLLATSVENVAAFLAGKPQNVVN